jgi:hypothetical protein
MVRARDPFVRRRSLTDDGCEGVGRSRPVEVGEQASHRNPPAFDEVALSRGDSTHGVEEPSRMVEMRVGGRRTRRQSATKPHLGMQQGGEPLGFPRPHVVSSRSPTDRRVEIFRPLPLQARDGRRIPAAVVGHDRAIHVEWGVGNLPLRGLDWGEREENDGAPGHAPAPRDHGDPDATPARPVA